MPLWTKVIRGFSARIPESGPNTGSTAETASAAIPLLAIAPPDAHRRYLERIAAQDGWAPLAVESSADAAAMLSSRVFPVVLYDRDLPGHDWRQVLHSLVSSPNPACVILASRVIDAYLWEEVVQHGGFDVLPKPYREQQAIRVLRFALSHWKTGWADRGLECLW